MPPLPHNLIVVPACDSCHGPQESRDDELFKFQLAISFGADQNPAARALWPSLIRAMAHPKKRGWAISVLKTLRTGPTRTTAGIHTGVRPTYELDVARLHRVARRIVRALYYKHNGCAVLATHEAVAYLDVVLGRARADIGDLLRFVLAAPVQTVGRGVFSYHARELPDDPRGFIARLVFFDTVGFLGFVTSRDASTDVGVAEHPP